MDASFLGDASNYPTTLTILNTDTTTLHITQRLKSCTELVSPLCCIWDRFNGTYKVYMVMKSMALT